MKQLIQEAFREIAAQPLIFAVEVVQFLLLAAIVGLFLRRIVGNKLKARRERIAADVEKADRADAAYAEAQQQATALVAGARTESQKIIEAARNAAEEELRIGLEKAEQEAGAILLQASQAVETDKEKVTAEAAERLVTLITEITRRFIDESLTESERRTATEKLILAGLKEIEGASGQ